VQTRHCERCRVDCREKVKPWINQSLFDVIVFSSEVRFDQEGNLVGAAEASAWDVAASFNGYGIGQRPEGPIEYEVTALGVKY
jgi:hypothetical protein